MEPATSRTSAFAIDRIALATMRLAVLETSICCIPGFLSRAMRRHAKKSASPTGSAYVVARPTVHNKEFSACDLYVCVSRKDGGVQWILNPFKIFHILLCRCTYCMPNNSAQFVNVGTVVTEIRIFTCHRRPLCSTYHWAFE